MESVQNEEKFSVVAQIIGYYCTHHNDIFEDVAEKHGYDVKRKEMCAEMSAVMFCEANVGGKASRVINKFLFAFLGR